MQGTPNMNFTDVIYSFETESFTSYLINQYSESTYCTPTGVPNEPCIQNFIKNNFEVRDLNKLNDQDTFMMPFETTDHY
jgi:hypothetical protein